MSLLKKILKTVKDHYNAPYNLTELPIDPAPIEFEPVRSAVMSCNVDEKPPRRKSLKNSLIRSKSREMYLDGDSFLKIARNFDVSVSTVYGWTKDLPRHKRTIYNLPQVNVFEAVTEPVTPEPESEVEFQSENAKRMRANGVPDDMIKRALRMR